MRRGASPDEALRETRRILEALKARGAPAIGFVNEGQLDAEGFGKAGLEILGLWLEAGHDLANHTRTHPDLNTTPLEAYEADVVAGETETKRLLAARGRELRWFRHPFTHTGPTKEIRDALTAFLGERGYRVAPHTVENADYLFNRLLLDARRAGKAEEERRILDAYLAHTDAVVAFAEELSRDLFGREIPQVLLLHANAIHAESLPALLERLSARGYAFVTLDRAIADDAYATEDAYVGKYGPTWLHRWAPSLGKPSRLRDEPDPPRWALEAFRESR